MIKSPKNAWTWWTGRITPIFYIASVQPIHPQFLWFPVRSRIKFHTGRIDLIFMQSTRWPCNYPPPKPYRLHHKKLWLRFHDPPQNFGSLPVPKTTMYGTAFTSRTAPFLEITCPYNRGKILVINPGSLTGNISGLDSAGHRKSGNIDNQLKQTCHD